MFRVIWIVLSFLLFVHLFVHCESINKTEKNKDRVLSKTEDRPYKKTISELLKVPEERRTKALIDRINSLERSFPMKMGASINFTGFVRELGMQDAFNLLDYLENNVKTLKEKEAVWKALFNYQGKKPAIAYEYLEKWAKRNLELTDSDAYSYFIMQLMKYHPNGVDILLKKVENKDEIALGRFHALCHLVDKVEEDDGIDTDKVLKRLRKLTKDKSKINKFNPQMGERMETIGEVVSSYIGRLESLKRTRPKKHEKMAVILVAIGLGVCVIIGFSVIKMRKSKKKDIEPDNNERKEREVQ